MLPYITITVPTYGIMVAIGAFSFISFLYYRNISDESKEICFKHFLLLIFFCGVGCLVGSKLLYTLTQLPALLQNFSVEQLLKMIIMSGLVFYGGLFGASLACVIFCKIFGYSLDEILNRVAPAFALFHSFGRIGCLCGGCCYGFRLSQPFQMAFGQLNYFPIQAVEAAFEFIMFIILAKMDFKKPVYRTYLTVYAVYRFISEFLRGDEVRGIWFGLSTSQWISLIILAWVGKNFLRQNGERFTDICLFNHKKSKSPVERVV